MILAIDAATKTGWALIKDGKVYESGVQDFSKRRGESNGAIFLRFRSWLSRMLDGVSFVCYELAHNRGGAATEIANNLTGRIQEACFERSIEYAPVHSATLKKWACGSGKADKVQMIERATTLLGRPPIDDNEADSVLMGAWAWEEYGTR
jgi:Holliday junction resolvasome RuvABC endonuclease subunit